MKLAVLPLVFAAAVVGQGENPAPAAMPTPIAQAMPTPASPRMHMGEPDVTSLLARLVSYFDLTHIASTVTTSPATITKVFDPTTGKFTIMSASVVQSGDSYYVPVCPVSAITAAGATPATAQSDACTFGVQLTPMPSNAASTLFRVLHTKVKLIRSLMRPSFWRGAMPFKGFERQAPPHAPMM
ncbi:hypothetical protein IWW50_000448 [Coemansia erecta]|nr:hypothetical protein IWW50_000448 [Coemansia erecta]